MTVIENAVAECGGARAISEFLQVTRQCVYVWMRRGYFPTDRALQIERKYGVPLSVLIKPETAQKLLNCELV